MSNARFISYVVVLSAALVAGPGGCATRRAGTADSETGARPSDSASPGSLARLQATNEVASMMDEPQGILTLRQALALALARSPELAPFSWDVRMGEARMLQAELRPNPEVGVEVENVLGTGEFRGTREAETTLQLSQIIELGGKRAARMEAMSLSRELAGWDYEAARLDVLARTAEAFVDVLSLQQRLALADETVRLTEQASEAVNRRVEAARTFAVEKTKAEVALASVRIERDQVQRELEAARQRLSASWGSARPRFERVEGDLDRLTDIPDLEDLQERLRQNPELARWAAELLQREAALKIERTRRVPDVTVLGGYRRLSGPDENAFVAGVSIPLPLFDRNQGGIREAEYRHAQARDEQRAAELRLTTALGQAWQRLSGARAEVDAIRENVLPGAQQAFETMNQYYSEGRLSYLEVLDTQRTLFAARAQYYRALSDYHQAVLAIERLIGEPLMSGTDQP